VKRPLFLLLLGACATPSNHDAIIEALAPDRPHARVPRTPLPDALPPDFAALPPEQRDAALLAMLSSDDPRARLLARQIRTLYFASIYVASPAASAPAHAPPFPSASWTVADEADWIIVGSGPAGSVLAHELRRGGTRVLVVEQGPLVWPGGPDTRALPHLVDARPTLDGSLLIRTGRAVGGGTTVNVDLAFAPTLPAVRRRLESWGWDVEGFARADEWVRALIGTRTITEDEINANNRILWEGAKAIGLTPSLYALNTHRGGDKRCAVRGLLAPSLLDRVNPLVLLPNTRVERVTFDGTRATGVELADGRRLRAKRVVLCAGAYGSPLILMRSHVANEHLGRGVIAHPSIPIIGEFDREIDAHVGTPASVYVDRSERAYFLEAMSAGPDYLAAMWPGTAREVREAVRNYRRMGGFGVMLVDSPHPDNRIESDGSIAYRLSDADAARLLEGIREGVRIMFKAGAKRVALPTVEWPILTRPEDADRPLRFIPSATVLTSAHLQSTCKMGRVVDREHRVIGRENLYVVDASVFPESCGANPMQTIYAMAKVFADRMHR
jgi:choline dehydrogenase-like flavoprotein